MVNIVDEELKTDVREDIRAAIVFTLIVKFTRDSTMSDLKTDSWANNLYDWYC